MACRWLDPGPTASERRKSAVAFCPCSDVTSVPPGFSTRCSSASQSSCTSSGRCVKTLCDTMRSTLRAGSVLGGRGSSRIACAPGMLASTHAIASGSTSAASRRCCGASRPLRWRSARPLPQPKSRTQAKPCSSLPTEANARSHSFTVRAPDWSNQAASLLPDTRSRSAAGGSGTSAAEVMAFGSSLSGRSSFVLAPGSGLDARLTHFIYGAW